jgi:ABC-2 type transport system ATP-binding protein
MSSSPVIAIKSLGKTYASGLVALKDVNLEIQKGEIFALLGPNGAGKTTLISVICGIVNPTSGSALVEGHDVVANARAARYCIGLVPQELTVDMFETVLATVSFSRGLYGCAPNSEYIEKILRDLSLWDKRKDKIMTLSGGMKRRVLIAKALSHEPSVLFLDEPSSGVDVQLRREMWETVRQLRESGVTIVLTTHYIEEAEQMADRVGVISKGELVMVEDKQTLMQKLGNKRLTLHLVAPLQELPPELSRWQLQLSESKTELKYSMDPSAAPADLSGLLSKISELGIEYNDLQTHEKSLEEIFVALVGGNQ